MFEDLFRVIQQVKERAQTYGQVLQKSEAQTRYSLIDPLLRALDWDVSDPACVRVEFNAEPGRADYALMRTDGKPVAMVEAKALDKNLKDSLTQGIAYCISGGIGYFMVTDGRRWELYETFRQVPLDQKLIAAFDIGSAPAHEIALKCLYMWKPNLSGPNLVPPPSELMPSQSQNGSAEVVVQPPVALRQPPVLVSPDTLTALNQVDRAQHDRPPARIVTPDGVSHPVGRWSHVLIETTKWLFERQILTPDKCPIGYPMRKRFIVATSPVHRAGRAFRHAARIGDLYVETNINGRDAVRHASFVIESLGKDPSTFRVGW